MQQKQEPPVSDIFARTGAGARAARAFISEPESQQQSYTSLELE